MIPLPFRYRVDLSTGVTDMRPKVRGGMPGLSLQVQEALGRNPHVPVCRSAAPKIRHGGPDLRREARAGGRAGDLYVFRGRKGDFLKVFWHDG